MPSSGKITTAAVDIRAKRVIRLHELPAFLGVKRSQISEAIRAGLLHPFTVILAAGLSA